MEQLADKGFADAQIEMGKLYRDGYRLPKDQQKARMYFNKALENGHPDAKQYLESAE